MNIGPGKGVDIMYLITEYEIIIKNLWQYIFMYTISLCYTAM